jgi:RNA-directed DNA polymerase
MKVPYVEDLANHSSPESCGGYGNVLAEALIGGNVGGLLSSEITLIRVLTPCTEGEGHVDSSVTCELLKDPAESKKLSMRGYFARGNQEIRERPNTETRSRCRVGRGRRKAVSLAHKISRKSDNNIVPKKQANKGKYRPGGVCGGKGVD